MYLIDDDGLNARKCRSGGGGENEEERLGGCDEDVRWVRVEATSVGRQGVTGSHSNRDLWLSLPHADALAGDAGEGRTQIAFYVYRKSLER